MDSGAVQPQTSDCGWGNQHAESFGPQSRGCRLSWRQSRDEDARVPNSPEAQGLATRLPHSRPARVCETCGHTDVSPALAPSFPLPRSPCGEGSLGHSGEDTHASPAKRPHTRHEGQGPGQGKVSSSTGQTHLCVWGWGQKSWLSLSPQRWWVVPRGPERSRIR